MNTNSPLSTEEDYKKSLVNTDVEPLAIPLDGGNSPEPEEEGQLKLYGFKLGDMGLLIENEVRREVVGLHLHLVKLVQDLVQLRVIGDPMWQLQETEQSAA